MSEERIDDDESTLVGWLSPNKKGRIQGLSMQEWASVGVREWAVRDGEDVRFILMRSGSFSFDKGSEYHPARDGQLTPWPTSVPVWQWSSTLSERNGARGRCGELESALRTLQDRVERDRQVRYQETMLEAEVGLLDLDRWLTDRIADVDHKLASATLAVLTCEVLGLPIPLPPEEATGARALINEAVTKLRKSGAKSLPHHRLLTYLATQSYIVAASGPEVEW